MADSYDKKQSWRLVRDENGILIAVNEEPQEDLVLLVAPWPVEEIRGVKCDGKVYFLVDSGYVDQFRKWLGVGTPLPPGIEIIEDRDAVAFALVKILIDKGKFEAFLAARRELA